MYAPLLQPRALAHMWTVREAVVLVNDQLAVAPRPLAGYYLAASVMNRVLYGEGDERWPQKALARIHASLLKPSPGQIVQPTTFLSYHGVPFAGVGLEFNPQAIPYFGADGAPHALASVPEVQCATAMVRQLKPRADLAAAEGDGGGFDHPVGSPPCFGQKENGRACQEELGKWLNLTAGQLPVCEELEAARPRRPERRGQPAPR